MTTEPTAEPGREVPAPAERDPRIGSNHSEVVLPRLEPGTSFNHSELLLG